MSTGDQYVPTAIDRMADVLSERDTIIRDLRAELDRVRGEGMDAMDREEKAASRVADLKVQLAAANARTDKYAETIAEHTVPLDQFTDMEQERDILRDSLATVTKERDDLDVRWGAEVGHANKWAAKFRAAESALASARQEAEALRAALTAEIERLVRRNDYDVGSENHLARTIVIEELRAILAAPMDAALPPAPVPAPAPDALAVLREALIAAKSKIVAESAFNMAGYGDFPGGDPRNFTPAPECSTDAEREAHRLACAAWDRGEQADLPAAHQWTTPDVAQAAMRDGTATIATIGPDMAHVQNVMFGLGSFTYEDDPATVELLAKIDAALDAAGVP